MPYTTILTGFHFLFGASNFLQNDMTVITPKQLAVILKDIKLIVCNISNDHSQPLHLRDIEEFLKLTFPTK